MQASRNNWKSDSLRCFEDTYRVLGRIVFELVGHWFGRYEKLTDQLRSVINIYFEYLFLRTLTGNSYLIW